jgi:hypothetical protein
MAWEATMSGVALLAVISILGILAVITGIGYLSLGILRDDRSGVLGAPAHLSRSSRLARQVAGVHRFNAQL